MTRFIVAEVSKNWTRSGPVQETTLSQMFETIIAINLSRGYRLHSWKLSQINDDLGALNETIVAVFEWKEEFA